MLVLLLSTLASYYTLKKLGDYLFPKEMNELYLTAGFYGLKLSASLYLSCEQFYNAYKGFLMDRTLDATSALLLIQNGNVVSEAAFSRRELAPATWEKYDLVLYKELLSEKYTDRYVNYKYHIIRLTKESDLANLPQPSTVRFLDILILVNQDKYTINFGSSNFYIVGNILFDKAFVQWYLKQFFNVNMVESYTCIIMDQNVNLITLDATNYILLAADSYSIVSVNNSSIKTE
jgi:hypothetical protein